MKEFFGETPRIFRNVLENAGENILKILSTFFQDEYSTILFKAYKIYENSENSNLSLLRFFSFSRSEFFINVVDKNIQCVEMSLQLAYFKIRRIERSYERIQYKHL